MKTQPLIPESELAELEALEADPSPNGARLFLAACRRHIHNLIAALRAARGAEHPAATPVLSVAARYCIGHIDAVLRGGLVADLNEPRGALGRVRDALANALREGER